jgi:hypothetical protein
MTAFNTSMQYCCTSAMSAGAASHASSIIVIIMDTAIVAVSIFVSLVQLVKSLVVVIRKPKRSQ